MDETKALKGELRAEGKTKQVYACTGREGAVIVANKNDITKNDNAAETMEFAGKAIHATSTTCAVFELLKAAGLPVAYESRLSPTEFLAKECRMIPLEVVLRRYVVPASSYLKRYPQHGNAVVAKPLRFHKVEFELYLKTSGGVIKSFDGETLGSTPLDNSGAISLPTGQTVVVLPSDQRPIDDPHIADPYAETWDLFHPKKPQWQTADANLNIQVPAWKIMPEGVAVQDIEKLARMAFLLLEGAWAQLGCRLVDLKIECGIGPDGKLYIADVIDNDSWRVRTSAWEELSKQLFRDNLDLAIVADKYALVAKLVENFKIPEQALVFWCGSTDDQVHLLQDKDMPPLPGVKVVKLFMSGHKKTVGSCKQLEVILADYPQGGAIIAPVGMSNGLAPTLAARTSWPVQTVPIPCKDSWYGLDKDIWSSLRTPSRVPLATLLSMKNAVSFAANILAQKNPALYMHRQYGVEELDDQILA